MDRKNYFYPDLPKAYQISQLYKPLCHDGHIEIKTPSGKKEIRIREIHLEEDAGKLIHDDLRRGTCIDLNRCGVPLIEIVTQPDIRSSEEVRSFLEILKAILKYTGISDCKMQEGSIRVDVNLSVRPEGSRKLGTKTEMKNLNSFRSIIRAVESEAARQKAVLEEGGFVFQETRRWDDSKGTSYSMRRKEEAHDYRYFPEPDLTPVEIGDQWLEKAMESIPELPEAKARRYIERYMLPEYDSYILTSSMELADFFERTVSHGAEPKTVSNWLMTEYMKLYNEDPGEAYEFAFAPESLAKMIGMIHDGYITGRIAKDIFRIMYDTGEDPEDIIRKKGIAVISDDGRLESMSAEVVSENPRSVSDYKSGKVKALGFLIGQVMKKSEGKADPGKVGEILKKILSE
jgi:aspartyl-tRNA(Asn)/glutamyl-tRNA(Gln) amidotransferase subunit B